ncbi:methyltransferase domain-containing protein [Micromonospora sp. BRA006-A]|uniref:class I SAM-dependent methyltransferase n=1 Tax=Micromonospora sp. BRA006-A TaxID=2962860 RepID=UPI00296F5944|nr:methyltransferase domain-containing protein [Micromonospora sp. BRA006-A]MDW3848633.1 methyltransferase domain-containing protein [Micromonospora sp. BRA006-A]
MDDTAYKTTVAAAFDRAAASYDRLGVEFFTPMGARLVERADPRPGQRVLDVGCGRGASLFPAAERVGAQGRVVGIDIAPAMVGHTRAEAARAGLRHVEVREMDGEHPDFPDASFDLVLGSYSVIFIPDAPQAMARYSRLLPSGGKMAFTSPVFTTDTFPFLPPMFTPLIDRELLRRLPEQWQPDALRRRFNSWLQDPEDLRSTMHAAGFRTTEVVDEPVRLVAESGAAWVDWSHTQGMRLLWQHLPPAEAAALRDRLIPALDALRDGDGPVRMDVPVRYVIAER